MVMKQTFLIGFLHIVNTAIVPPPWADSSLNPCASQPGGWLFLFWPPDGRCYRIFQRGPPCPDTMELGPVQDTKTKKMVAECRCPPGTAQSARDAKCYQIFTQGPCRRGQYFNPVPDSQRKRWGKCLDADSCDSNELFWPQNGKCYQKHSRGPCPMGQLLSFNQVTGLAECKCEAKGSMLKYYWSATKSCHQLYTKGPCLEKGLLLLPGPQCGCYKNLPNYHNETRLCYELGSIGPCMPGHKFEVDKVTNQGRCVCKPDHVKWSDGSCYRLYTKGPCQPGQIIINETTCITIPCRKGRLYFPEADACYRVGVQGPCPSGQLVLFERSIRPSIDGVSYKGMCGCSGTESERHQCETSDKSHETSIKEIIETSSNEANYRTLDSEPRRLKENKGIEICETNKQGNETCHVLYTQGPCSFGEWLVPNRRSRGKRNSIHVPRSIDVYINHRFRSKPNNEHQTIDQELKAEASVANEQFEPKLYQDTIKKETMSAHCECRDGFVRTDTNTCQLPFIQLAKFLNGQDYFSNGGA